MTPRDVPMREAVSAFKRALVLEALAAQRGNRSRAAAALKIERTSLLRLIRELGISGLPGAYLGRPVSLRKQLADQEGASRRVRPVP